MSLFKAREWWSCQVGNGEQFDYGCLKVGSFNDETNHKVVVGSHSGVLRIYNPTGSESDAVHQSHATDLLLERNLGMPIIQVEIGHFAGTSDSKQIAVLFSQKLSVFDYNEQSGMTEHGRQVGLELNYEHNFNRPTFNMCKGQFGGGRGSKDSTNHEYICVQTLDGVLYVFENERQSMAKSLPNTYLPGPIAYLSRPDAFLTVSSNYHLECYKYQTLAISSGLDSSSTNANDARRKGMDDDPSVALSQSASKRIQPEWTFNLGEAALGIQVSQRVRQSQQTILVLGERNLFCLNENGQMIFMKKFEYNPSSFVVYHHEASLSSSQTEGAGAVGVRYIIGTHSHTLFICQDAQIRWAAHVESVPVHIDVCTLQGVRGMICTLSETGQLQCCYLGTDPVSTTISTVTPGSSINSQEAKEQLDKLDKKIKEAMNDPSLIVRRKSNAQVSLKIDASEQFSMTDETRFLRSDVESSVPSTALRISVKSTEAIQNALLTVHVHSPLCAQPNEIRLGHIGGTAAIGTGTITFWMRDDLTPWNLEATFTVSYNTMSDNASHTVQKVHKLPLKLVAHAVQQAPSAANAGSCKITIGANKPVVDPGTIFPELANGDSSQQGVNARFYGSNQNVCVLASSKSQKYRIQSDSIASTWLFCQMLIERLSASSSIEFEYGDALPYQDYFALIDRHFEYRVECEQLNATLDICSKQFRAIQKRLLNKFKDKTPTLLDNLDVLSESTSQQILALADRYEQSRYELDRCSHDLSCTTKLICLLLKISVNLSSENTRLLNAILSPVISDDNEQGWEETVESAVCYALRTSLARSKSSDLGTSSNTIGNSTVNMDISRLKKRIQTLCERMEKGGSLVSSDSYSDRGNSTESSYSASSTSNPKGRSSSSSAGYSSHREMNNGEDEENGLPTDDHGSTFLLLPSTNSRRTIREEDEDD